MNTGNSVLIDLIRNTIREKGAVTFEWFMDRALYHPELGYYSSGRCAIGRRGDYFTNVSVGAVFGQLLAAQFAEIWDILGRPSDFTIVEQGAHHGDFARDVLETLRSRVPTLFAVLRYWIIEPFPILQTRQRETLAEFTGKVTWQASMIELRPFCGVHFSNEFLDSFPVRLITRVDADIGSKEGSDWLERSVRLTADKFDFVTTPIEDVELARHIEKIPRPLSVPYETEVNLGGLRWMESLAPKLIRGYVLTIDYGYRRTEYYAPHRSAGTIQYRSNHRIVASPFFGIGETDMTAHIDWTSLAEWAEACGLSVAAFTDQHRFISGIVTTLMADQFTDDNDFEPRRSLQTLLHPELLGTSFQVLALTKDVAGPGLSGFRFAREPRSQLGL